MSVRPRQVIAAVLTIFCSGYSFAAAPTRKVVIGHAAMNARVAPLWVAEDHGLFVKHGVNVNAIFIRQAPVLVAALTAGDVPGVLRDTEAAVAAGGRGTWACR